MTIVKEFFYSLKNKYYERKYGQDFKKKEQEQAKHRQMIDDINDDILPLSYKQTEDGKYIQTNDTFIQCLVVGRLTPKMKDRQDYPTNLDPRLIDDILNIGTKKETSIELCQVIYPLKPEDENEALEQARRNIAISSAMQEQRDKVLGMHNRVNDFAAEGLDEYHRQVFNGTTRLFRHVLLVAVQGVTTEEVNKTMNLIRTYLDSKRVLHETPIQAMKETYKTMTPTPYVWQKLFKRSVHVQLCAKTSLLRNPNPLLATSGRFLGINERTGNPIFFNFSDPTAICGHAMYIGMSGSGKSTDLLKDDIRAYLDGDNVIHIVPKKDGLTNHLKVCETFAGQLIKVGHGGLNFNMLQVFFDPSIMEDYQAAYSAHFTSLLTSMGLLVGSGFSDPQKNWLYQSLVELYSQFHVIDENGRVINTEKWTDGTFWPDFEDWRDILWTWLNDGQHKNVSSPIEALYNNTAMLTRNGPLGYLVNKNGLDLSNQMIMADISALDDTPNVQEAITMMLMSIVYTKLSITKPGAAKVRTLLTLDEGADLVKNPTMEKSIEKLFRQGRAWGLYIKIVSQDLAGFPSTMLEMIKANTDYILLFGNMRSDNVEPIEKEFKLNPEEVSRLLEPGHGRGLMIIGGNRIPYANILDDFESLTIFGTEPIDSKLEEQIQEPVFIDEPFVKWVNENCKFTCKDWLIDPTKYPNGYEKMAATNPITGRQTVVFYNRSLMEEDGSIKNQLPDHYFTVGLWAGEALRMGADFVSLDDYGTGQEADIVIGFTLPDGSKRIIAGEYETPESNNSVKDLQAKRDRLVTRELDGAACFSDVIFTCKKPLVEKLEKAAGKDFVKMRGSELREYLENIQLGKLPIPVPCPVKQKRNKA
jgi:hypothetical protein